MFVISAALLCQVVSSGGSSCSNGYTLNYTLPMGFKCKVIMTNGCGIPLIPKLIPWGITAKNSSGRLHDNIPAVYICRIPDCWKNPCLNGWCQDELTNYTCHCPPEFAGIHCESKISTTEVEETTSTSLQTVSGCQSNPCLHGGKCTGTAEGFQCNCTTEYYGLTCACLVIHTSESGRDNWNYTVPDPTLDMSFDFEVSTNYRAGILLSGRNGLVANTYKIVLGANGNTGGWIFHYINEIGNFDLVNKGFIDPALALSGIPVYDHYHVSFANGHIGIYRSGNDTPLMEYIDPDPIGVTYVGTYSYPAEVAYWKFLSFCS